MTSKSRIIKTARAILKSTDEVQAALYLAETLFEGYQDKSGAPYIQHVFRVASGIPAGGALYYKRYVVALLHDVLEDIPGWGARDLKRVGFEEDIIDAIISLTHPDKQTPYFNDIVRAGLNPLALPVKRSDLRDNSNVLRLDHLPTEADLERLMKYFLSDKYLESIEKGQSAQGTCFATWMRAQPEHLQDEELLAKYYRAPTHS